ncbi:Nicotinate-nucleotide pyrophosphorylase (carboxylating) [Candidatus Methylobacter favarea]|uniref:Probable nicotinate-nucleotide pyrophosphorylase [carboxylating] n=1 Tax=Candidatus Methylobacter favarea TaxID=2707345 RepID=A0A8S0W9K3_9GAMM|nr:carboxylating nicotinate-nucleotide diphosphorylase [Candidatus Methylobacter favarea]CAA9890026.1 Nicotinate-nucleotide pyrophosphorylase (carboxylating) [Candidatus Methylobacter favarea]
MSDLLKITEIKTFLEEDIGEGDLSATIISDTIRAEAEVITRQNMVLCGQAWFEAIFRYLDNIIQISWIVAEGETANKDSIICTLKGPAKSLLTGERTALNLLQTLSSTATIARQFADAVAGTGCKVLDTRKTIPGLRNAQKYAVTCGGCYNHRMGLYDGVLIKENHIMAAGSIRKAIESARRKTSVPVEVEVENMKGLLEAISAKPDRIMLDNFSLQNIRAAVALNEKNIELEASGNINLDNIRAIAETGVDYISIGALTKHIKAVDLSMRINLVK